MTLYVYDADTMTIVAEFEGKTNQECEAQFECSLYADDEIYGTTYSPAFGCVSGLHY